MLKDYSKVRTFLSVIRIVSIATLLIGFGVLLVEARSSWPDYTLFPIIIIASFGFMIFTSIADAVVDIADINQRMLKHFDPEDSWFDEGGY